MPVLVSCGRKTKTKDVLLHADVSASVSGEKL